VHDRDAATWIDSITAGARNPHNWLAAGEELKRGSDLLRTVWLDELTDRSERFEAYMRGEVDRPWEPWVGAPAMTLAAFAIENLLKGIMVAADPALIQPDQDAPEILLGRQLRTHDLCALARRARVDISEEEMSLLERLTEFAQWAGRYRFPLRARAAAPRPGSERGGSSFTSDWFPTLDALFERLHSDLLFEAGRRADRAKEAATAP
jgi:hypothetical protein